jgi:hypothetical protein
MNLKSEISNPNSGRAQALKTFGAAAVCALLVLLCLAAVNVSPTSSSSGGIAVNGGGGTNNSFTNVTLYGQGSPSNGVAFIGSGNGRFVVTNAAAGTNLNLRPNGQGAGSGLTMGPGGNVGVNAPTPTNTVDIVGTFYVGGNASNTIPVIFRVPVGQRTNVIEVQNSSGTVLSGTTSNGQDFAKEFVFTDAMNNRIGVSGGGIGFTQASTLNAVLTSELKLGGTRGFSIANGTSDASQGAAVSWSKDADGVVQWRSAAHSTFAVTAAISNRWIRVMTDTGQNATRQSLSNAAYLELVTDTPYGYMAFRSMADGSNQTTKPFVLGNGTGIQGTNWSIKIGTNISGGELTINNTVSTTAATAAVINQNAGRVRLSSGSQSYFVTNALITANSVVTATLNSDDATATAVKAIPSAGLLQLKLSGAAAANADISFFLLAP